MNMIHMMLPLALLLGGGFLVSFIVMARNGQYDDLETPAYRILLDDDEKAEKAAEKAAQYESKNRVEKTSRTPGRKVKT